MKVVAVLLFKIVLKMEKNLFTNITVDGINYDIIDGGVKCPECPVSYLCIGRGLGSKVQFDCASVHLVKSNKSA